MMAACPSIVMMRIIRILQLWDIQVIILMRHPHNHNYDQGGDRVRMIEDRLGVRVSNVDSAQHQRQGDHCSLRSLHRTHCILRSCHQSRRREGKQCVHSLLWAFPHPLPPVVPQDLPTAGRCRKAEAERMVGRSQV
ncbi:hypothetical protein XENOCAPTIV_008176 [Xenoophorus captivus]|uniref:Secreted protein n=1 Tax=Xenoophorus captivus TaxID=1517983 RepID=A0ABV0QH53_9TELE